MAFFLFREEQTQALSPRAWQLGPLMVVEVRLFANRHLSLRIEESKKIKRVFFCSEPPLLLCIFQDSGSVMFVTGTAKSLQASLSL